MDSLSISSDRTKRLSVISKRTTRSDSALPSSHSQLLQKEIPVDLLFQEASMKNNVSAVKYLLTFDVDVNKKSQLGRAPIHWAIINNNPEIVSLLIQAKCDIESSDKFETRPILMAAMVGNLEIVKMLIEAGCDCRVMNKKHQTVLHCAVKHDQNEILAYLLDNVIDIEINSVNEQGRTAAHWASFKGYHQILDCLLRAGIKADERDQDGKTALHLAAEYGFKKALNTLIEHKSDIFSTDSKGRTALMIASALGYLEVVAKLIEYGANVNSKDKKGNTGNFLKELFNSCVLEFLFSYFFFGSFTSFGHWKSPKRKQTPLVIAAELGNTEVAEVLIAHNADLFFTEKSGRTALYIASRGSFQALVDMLIKAEREQYFKFDSMATNSTNINRIDVKKQSSCDSNNESENVRLGYVRKILYYVSRHHLDSNDWKKMARFWNFTEDQIKAIEHQYTGKTSYKDHAYRMLLIWLHGLSPSKDPFNEIYDALIYIDREEIVEKIQKKIAEDSFYHRRRFRCHCLPAIPSTVCHYCSIV
ncbi:ankyrin repeat domain containing protein 26 [Sarcoptes scabiei]|uniref:Ankyrin repeat domain containing protein 26 n=1 Tax=Sarcoptes scabiei TaxID=52283 RepID=A0A132AFQ8_SARSC|nr:ankyrin repeat domain containing protein 26 [Sarcoptes scabiei]